MRFCRAGLRACRNSSAPRDTSENRRSARAALHMIARDGILSITFSLAFIVRHAWALFLLALFTSSLLAQVPATIGQQYTSEEHLAKPGWWPRKGDAPRSDYVGAEVCAQCHATLAAGQAKHAMPH